MRGLQRVAPRARREYTASTVQYLALLRALGMVVDSHGVSHAQLERILCERLTAGRKAEEMLRGQPQPHDRDRLQRLVARKSAVEESGLARTDGRRDKAGGQRIGELLAGKFPRAGMPPRRRVEVCVDVFLEVLEGKDPTGYAEDMYGSRELWFGLWLEADQGNIPKLGDRATTVKGYVETALQQLKASSSDQSAVAKPPGQDTDDLPEQDPGVSGIEARPGVAGAQAAGARSAGLSAAEGESARGEPAQAPAERGEAARRLGFPEQQKEADLAREPRHRLSATVLLAMAAVTLAVISTGLIVALAAVLREGPALSRIFQFPVPYALTPGSPGTTVPFNLADTGRKLSWNLALRLRLASMAAADACVHDSQLTYTLLDNGRVIGAGSLPPGQSQITTGPLHVGVIGGGHRLELIVTVAIGKLDSGCQFTIDPSGTTANARG
jgi:hypothetical protein